VANDHADWLSERAVELLDLAVWTWEPGSEIVRHNHRWNNLTGFEPGSDTHALGAWKSLVHPEDLAIVEAAIAEAPKTGAYEARHRIVTPRGDVRWVCDRGRIDEAAGTGEAVFVGVTRDVTEQEENAERLRQNEGRLQALTNNVPVALMHYVRDAKGVDHISYVSPGCGAIWELKDAEITADASKVWEVVHPDDVADLLMTVDESASHLTPWRAQWRIVLVDNEVKWLQGHGLPERLEDGGVRWSTVVQDITHQKNMEQQLRASEQRFRDLADNLPGAVFRYLLHPDGTDSIDFMSDGCEQLWEVTADELKRDPTLLWNVIFPEDLPAMQASVMKSAETLSSWTHAWRIRLASGEVKWLEGHGQPSRLEDGSILWNSLILDVTSEIEARDVIRQQESDVASLQSKLAHVARISAMGELTSSLAHEINQPLSAVLNFVDTARERCRPEACDEQLPGLLDKATEQAERAAEIIRRLRNLFSRGEIERSPDDLNVVVEEALRVAETGIANAPVITRTYAGDLKLASVDRIQLQQVILNLVRNAAEAMDGQEDAAIAVETAASAGGSAIVVRDNGPGIAPEILDGLFEPFLSTKADGTGIGLSLCNSIVRAHSGGLSGANAPEGGAVFTIRLPNEPA